MISEDYFLSFSKSDLDISADDITDVINKGIIPNNLDYRPQVIDILGEIFDMADYRGQLTVFPDPQFDDEKYIITVNNIAFSLNEVLYNEMRGSEMAAFFICTAGDIYSDLSRKYIGEGDYLKGYIFDVAGSVAVEKITCLIRSKLSQSVTSKGMKTTNYYCPGNCGWDIGEQNKLFELINGEYTGVVLGDSGLMRPLKSLSGIIGIGNDVLFRENTCEVCNNKRCMYRSKTDHN